MTNHIREALDRAFPIFQMGGLSGAMYPADEGKGHGWAISNEDWEVVTKATRKGKIMEVTGKNAPVLVDGRYLEPGEYLVIPVSDGGEDRP